MRRIESLQSSEQKQKLSMFWVENIIWKILSREENCQSSDQKRLYAKCWAEKVICKVLIKKEEKFYFETCPNIWVMSFARENSLVSFERYWKLSTKIKLKRQRPPSRQGGWVWIYVKAKTKIYVLGNNSWKSFLENKDKMVWSFDLSPKLALWLLLQR